MGISIADIFGAVHLNLETGQFEVDALKSTDIVAGKMAASLKKAAGGALGAGVGLALSSAINGATQLNQLAGDYRVQTGASAAEAKAFTGTLNDLFMTSHQGYDEIAATLTGLKTHFDLSGQAAKDLAANILDFAEIAGGTGTDAVERLNSLVKTGVIGEADMAATMDKLTVAHQRWGININETADSLVKFAPAMNAFGMSTDQAIAWMSIFNKAGVDAQRVTMGFNTALQKVKSPAEFNTLVAQIAATADNTDRAKLAISLFGARAGGALANMLRPGSESVADMAAIIGTDYTGAVEKAAEVNDSTFGGQAILMLHKFQGALAGTGTNMGDLLIVFATLGPQLTKVVLGSLGGLAGLLLPKIAEQLGLTLPAWLAGGTAAGAAQVGAEAATVAAGGPLVAAAVTAQTPEVVLAAGAMGGEAGAAAAAATATSFASRIAALVARGAFAIPGGGGAAVGLPLPELPMDKLEAAWPKAGQQAGEAFAGAAVAAIKGRIARGEDEVGAAAGGIGQVMATRMARGEDEVSGAASLLASGMTSPVLVALARLATSTKSVLGQIAQDYRDKWSELTSIATDAAATIYGRQHRADALSANSREQSAQRAIIASKKSTAQEKRDARSRLLALQEEGLGIRIEMAGRGELTKTAYDALISDLQKQAKSGNAEVANAARLALAELEKLKAEWNTAPADLHAALIGAGHRARPTATGGRRNAGELLKVGELGPELWVPDTSGYMIPHNQLASVGAGMSGGVTYNIPVTVQGLVRARNPLEIAQQARRFARLGTVAPPATEAA
jgi:hypothetical protein